MEAINYGRKTFSFAQGVVVLTGTCVTEKSMPDEDETNFISRLLEQYKGRRGTIEIVFKNGRPDYAFVTLI